MSLSADSADDTESRTARRPCDRAETGDLLRLCIKLIAFGFERVALDEESDEAEDLNGAADGS